RIPMHAMIAFDLVPGHASVRDAEHRCAPPRSMDGCCNGSVDSSSCRNCFNLDARYPMSTEMKRIVAALWNLLARDLDALRIAAERAPQVVPGLLAWLEHAVGWELDRREGRSY